MSTGVPREDGPQCSLLREAHNLLWIIMRPTTTEVQDIKFLIASRLDVAEFLDILGWTMFDLVDNLDDSFFEDKFEDLMDACD
jgi:hypothetical protein